MTTDQLIAGYFRDAIPVRWAGRSSDWCREHVKLPGSTLSKAFDPSITPWIVDVINDLDNPKVRRSTFVKPVQSGGSVAGECVIAKIIAESTGGDVQYNWQNDENASERFSKRVERILQACKPVMDRAPDLNRQAGKWTNGLILFPHCNFIMQGVHTKRRVASDSITYQVNEEVHDTEGWIPGRLKSAFGRTTTVWNHKIWVISNAGKVGSELHQEYESGTMQQWEVKCPGCGKFHVMRTHWEDERPDLGGLRYDGIKTNGRYDYNKIVSTIRYQMPCGYRFGDIPSERRPLSLSGRYGEPTNVGSDGSIISRTLEAVSVDYIPFIKLIQEKHDALRAMKNGDPELWYTYKRERECKFWSENDKPLQTAIELSSKPKGEDSLQNAVARFAFFDRQQGSAAMGEVPHWWGMIADVDATGRALPIFEGRLTDSEVVETVKRYKVKPFNVCCDSGDDTKFVYEFCLANGFNATKGEGKSDGAKYYKHSDGAKRIFSEIDDDFVFDRAGAAPYCKKLAGETMEQFEDRFAIMEPRFILFSKEGFFDRLAWMISSKKWIHPSDASEAYKLQMQSWEVVKRKHSRTDESVLEWKQIREADHLWACASGIVLQIEMACLIGQDVEEPKE